MTQVNMMPSRNKKIALIGLMTACGILFGYIEFLFPLPIGIPGVKLGLSNIITLICMSVFGPYETLLILVLRVVLSGVLFGNLFGILYGMAGALLSFAVMFFVKRTNRFSIIGVSALGGVFHNIGQLLVAMAIVSELKLSFYLPVLIISGLVCGLITGIASNIMIPRVRKIISSQGNI